MKINISESADQTPQQVGPGIPGIHSWIHSMSAFSNEYHILGEQTVTFTYTYTYIYIYIYVSNGLLADGVRTGLIFADGDVTNVDTIKTKFSQYIYKYH